jgi:hypothetical protein
VNVGFWSDSGGSPGTQIGSGSDIAASGLTGSFASTTSTVSSLTLTGGTQYWVTVNRSNSGTDNSNYVGLQASNSASALGFQSGAWHTTGDSLPATLLFEVDGTTAAGAQPDYGFLLFFD